MKNDEEILCGQIFINNDVFYKTTLTEKDFQCPDCRIIFKAMQGLSNKGVEIDEVKIRKECPEVDLGWLSTLRNKIPTAANFEYYQNRIKEDGSKHALYNLSTLITANLSDGLSSAEVRNLVEKELTELATNADGWEVKEIGDVMRKTIDTIEERYKLKGKLPGLTTGFTLLNEFTLGFRPRMLYLFGARPSRGKTALMLNMAVATAKEHCVGIINTESANEEMGMRIISSQSGMDSQKIASGYVTEADIYRLGSTAQLLAERKIYFYDEPNASLTTVIAKCREMVRKNKVECIFIDYIQNIFYNEKNTERENLGYISTQLKSISRSLKVPIVAMAQLRREGENSYKRPVMSDLLGSGKLEQDADVIGLIWWQLQNADEVKEGKDPEFNEWLLVDKNRDGITGAMKLKFHRSTVKFTEITQERI